MADEQKYVPTPNAVDISPDQDGALYKEIIKEGSIDEKPSAGDKVIVHYVGTLLDGSEFDSSRSRDQKFDFMLGKGNVIKGWDVGVATMKKGEVAKLICSPEYGYGAAGSPPKIPPNSTLVFEVELFDWQCEDLSPHSDGGIQRKIINAGDGYSSPNDGATVDLHIVGKYNGNTFEDRDLKFQIGEGSDHGIVEGLEIALLKFKKNEKSIIKLTAPYAFRDIGKEEYNIPPGANVEYEITLNDFEKEKESWELDADEKLEQAKLMKQKGTDHFKAGKFSSALKKYNKIATFLDVEATLKGDKLEEKNALLLAGYLNVAACQLKLLAYFEAQKACDKALEIDSENVKGLFRRGQAYFGIKDYENAVENFSKVMKLDPTNKAAKNQATICQNKIKQFHEKERKTYQNMFEKFAEYDERNAPKTETIQNAPKTEKIQNGSNDEETQEQRKSDKKEPWEDEMEIADDNE